MHKPYSIKIFLPGGDPDGIRTIEKSNWSGAGLVVPRAMMAEAKAHARVHQALGLLSLCCGTSLFDHLLECT
jgi:hypothetical protein